MPRGWSLSILIGFCILNPQAIKQQLILYAVEKTSLVAPELRGFFCFFSCKWLAESDSSTVQSNIENGTWQLNASANWMHTLWPLGWDLIVIGNPRIEHYNKYKEREICWGQMLKREDARRGKKGEVEEPGIMEPVRMTGPSREALVKTCIFGKISILFYLTQLLSPEEKNPIWSCRGRRG